MKEVNESLCKRADNSCHCIPEFKTPLSTWQSGFIFRAGKVHLRDRKMQMIFLVPAPDKPLCVCWTWESSSLF